jgi:ABC-type Fe3+-hydroxamate transport system substrate-binding protein
VLPPEAREKASVVGGTKSPRVDVIRSLKPDLILSNKEENREQDVSELDTVAPVYVAFPRDLTTALEELRKLGTLLRCDDTARGFVDNLALARTNLTQESRTRAPFRFLYLIWQKPYMAAGTATFIDAFIREAGGRNVIDPKAGRYPQLTVAEIEELRPDVVLFSSEPFPFEAKHTTELLSATGDPSSLNGRTLLVDGQLLSWHGARLRDGIPYLADLAREIVALGDNSR